MIILQTCINVKHNMITVKQYNIKMLWKGNVKVAVWTLKQDFCYVQLQFLTIVKLTLLMIPLTLNWDMPIKHEIPLKQTWLYSQTCIRSLLFNSIFYMNWHLYSRAMFCVPIGRLVNSYRLTFGFIKHTQRLISTAFVSTSH